MDVFVKCGNVYIKESIVNILISLIWFRIATLADSGVEHSGFVTLVCLHRNKYMRVHKEQVI
jgi:hypothetical protein